MYMYIANKRRLHRVLLFLVWVLKTSELVHVHVHRVQKDETYLKFNSMTILQRMSHDLKSVIRTFSSLKDREQKRWFSMKANIFC